jgi:hypothetical protein
LKKEPKNFHSLSRALPERPGPVNESLLLLFFRKEGLSDLVEAKRPRDKEKLTVSPDTAIGGEFA